MLYDIFAETYIILSHRPLTKKKKELDLLCNQWLVREKNQHGFMRITTSNERKKTKLTTTTTKISCLLF